MQPFVVYTTKGCTASAGQGSRGSRRFACPDRFSRLNLKLKTSRGRLALRPKVVFSPPTHNCDTEMETNMNEQTHLTRRQFLSTTGKTATALAAASAFGPAILSAKSPNEVIGVGCIGLGTRGGDLINGVVNCDGVRVNAVCDVYGPHRQKGVERSMNSDVKAFPWQDAAPAQPHGGFLQLRPQPRHAQVRRGRGVRRDRHVPDVRRILLETADGAMGCCEGRNRVTYPSISSPAATIFRWWGETPRSS